MDDKYLDKLIENASNQYEVGDIQRMNFYFDVIKDYIEFSGISEDDKGIFQRWNESFNDPIDIDWDFVEEK